MIPEDFIKQNNKNAKNKLEYKEAIENLKVSTRAIILIVFPFIVSYLIWIVYMDPVTYLEKLASIIFGIITVGITFWLEFAIFD